MIERQLSGSPRMQRPNVRLTNVGTPEVSARVARRLIPAPRIVGPLLTSGAGTPMISAESRRASFRSIPALSPDLDNFVLHGLEYGQLGFSLKPPRWIRKAQPGVFIKKNILPITLAAAALTVPGVAPFALHTIVGAGKLVGKGVSQIAKAVTSVTGRKKSLLDAGVPQQAINAAMQIPTMPPLPHEVPITTPVALTTLPAPSTEIPGVAMGTNVMSPSDSGDGGSALTSASGDEAPLIGPPEPKPTQAGMSGTAIAIVVGLGLLMLMKKPRRA